MANTGEAEGVPLALPQCHCPNPSASSDGLTNRPTADVPMPMNEYFEGNLILKICTNHLYEFSTQMFILPIKIGAFNKIRQNT
jgi:hypothetical protein